MHSRWLLEDAASALNAQLQELAPSLLARADAVHPLVRVRGAPAAFVRARAWRDSGFEAQARLSSVRRRTEQAGGEGIAVLAKANSHCSQRCDLFANRRFDCALPEGPRRSWFRRITWM